MRVGIAADHGGFGLREELVAQLRAAGRELVEPDWLVLAEKEMVARR